MAVTVAVDVDVAMAMDVDMDVAVAVVGVVVAVVGVVVAMCMVMVVDVGMGAWGKENGGWRRRGSNVQVEPSMRQRSNFKVQLCHVMLKQARRVNT